MGKILRKIQATPRMHGFLRNLYGKTFGFWWLKDWYIRNIGFWNGRKKIRMSPVKKIDTYISSMIRSGKPFALARYGTTEFRTIFEKDHLTALCTYSGFFPNNSKLWYKFKNLYLESSKNIDILVAWNYKNNFLKEKWLVSQLRNLEAISSSSVSNMGHKHLWISELKGKKLLVVHPFKKTIEKQLKIRDKIGILPRLKSVEVIKAVQTIAGNKDSRFDTWFDALEYMKKEISKKDFDIAIIGCGAYGLPLASYVKSLGKQAIHMAGSTQLLFGIKGKRWGDSHPMMNKYWIYPLNEDTPKNIKKVEGGCYW